MAIKLSSLAVITTAFLVAGTLVWIGMEEETRQDKEGNVAGANAYPASSIIKVGWVGPFSDENSSPDESIKRGFELAQRDLKANYIKTKFTDVGCDQADANESFRQFLQEDGVDVIVSTVCPSVGQTLASASQRDNVVLISPNHPEAKFTAVGDYVFSTISDNINFGEFAARTILQENLRNIVILYGDDEISRASHESFLHNFHGPDIITVSQELPSASTDYGARITEIKTVKPDGILIITNSGPSAIAILDQIGQAGISAPVYGSSIIADQNLISETSTLPEDLSIITPSRGTDEFIARYKEVYNESPGVMAAQAYDLLVALARSIEAGADNSPLIKDRLKTIQFAGASGYIQFDERRNVPDNFQIFTVDNGRLILKASDPAPI